MATKFYCRSTTTLAAGAPGTPPDSGAYYDLLTTSSGSGTFTNAVPDGPVTPPTAGTHLTKVGAGAPVTFVTAPLLAFTCAGTVTIGAYAKESDLNANVSRIWARVGRLSPTGVYTWFSSGIADTAELTGSSVAYTATATPTSTAFADGDRLVAEFYLDDAAGFTMAGSGRTTTYTEDAAFFVQVNETVTLGSVAPTVTTTTPTGITAISAASGGNVTAAGDAPVTARGVCWNTGGTPTIADSKTSDGTGTGSFSSAAISLLPVTTYHLRAYATNGIGTSYGAENDFDTLAAVLAGALGRTTVWARALTVDEALTDASAGQEFYERSLAKGTVVIKGTMKNRLGAPVPAHHVRAGWWIQNLETGTGKPLYITGHSVDLAEKKNALTIGIDWMEKEIGVRQADLLAIPATVVPDLAPD